MDYKLVLLVALLVIGVYADEPAEEIKDTTRDGWGKFKDSVSGFIDKASVSIVDTAKKVGAKAEEFAGKAATEAQKVYHNAKTELGITSPEVVSSDSGSDS